MPFCGEELIIYIMKSSHFFQLLFNITNEREWWTNHQTHKHSVSSGGRKSPHRCLINFECSVKSAHTDRCSIPKPWFLSKESFLPKDFSLAERIFEVCSKFLHFGFYHSFIFYVWVFTFIASEQHRCGGWDESERQHDSLVSEWNIFSNSFLHSAVQSPLPLPASTHTLRLRSIWIMIKFTSKWILLDGFGEWGSSVLGSGAWQSGFQQFSSELRSMMKRLRARSEPAASNRKPKWSSWSFWNEVLHMAMKPMPLPSLQWLVLIWLREASEV